MSIAAKLPWDLKYRPTSLDNFIFETPKLASYFKQIVDTKNIPNLLMFGPRGTGKTTLARILIEECGIDPMDVLTVNASAKTGVEYIRETITNFVTTASFGGHKVVFLDECDYLSPNAQASLRTLTLDYADVASFILCCNYIHRVIPELISRCESVHMKAGSEDDVAEYIISILLAEKINITAETVDTIAEYIATGYPDIRKIVKLTQQNIINGVLVCPDAVVMMDSEDELINCIRVDDWNAFRKIAIECSTTPAEYELVYRILYENLHLSPINADVDAYDANIIAIADFLFKHYTYADPEINFTACIYTIKSTK